MKIGNNDLSENLLNKDNLRTIKESNEFNDCNKSTITLKNVVENENLNEDATEKLLVKSDEDLTKQDSYDFFSVYSIASQLLNQRTITNLTSYHAFIFHLINLIILSNDSTNSILYTSTYQLGCVYLMIFGFNFLNGTLDSLKSVSNKDVLKNNTNKFITFYHNTRIFSLLAFLIIVFPFCLTSNYFFQLFQVDVNIIDLTDKFVRLCMIAYILLLFANINSLFLQYLEKTVYILATNITCICIHTVTSILFVYFFEYGSEGIAFSMIISSLFKLVITQFFCWYLNTSDKDVLYFDTSVIDSDNFFYHCKNSSIMGFLAYIKYLPFELVLFLGYFFGYIDFYENIIIWNIIHFYYALNMSILSNITFIFRPIILNTISKSSELEIKEFLENGQNKSLKGYFDKKVMNKNFSYKQIFEKMNNNKKLTTQVNKINSLFHEYNQKKIQKILDQLNRFFFGFCMICTILLFFLRYNIIYWFTKNKEAESKIITLINLYAVVLWFDTAELYYMSLIGCFSNVFNFIIVRGLFGVFLFLPLGIVLCSTFSFGIHGFWFSFYLYFITFSAFSYVYFKSFNLNEKCKMIRHIYSMNINTKDDYENIYRIAQN